ncbi:MAG: DUF3412 domain-containing protein, partial [Planctomycetales bacterium]
IEKRLEAFVRLGHGIVVFPGGAGTAEEILYLLGVLLHPKNVDIPLPLVFTGPEGAATYFEQVDKFIRLTLGEEASSRYQIVVGDAEKVAQIMSSGMNKVRKYRIAKNDAFYYNWLLTIEESFQIPFHPTHENMRALELSRDLPLHVLASNLRKLFSGIVAGNVKPEGVQAIREFGPFEISGEPEIMDSLDALLTSFIANNRMKLPSGSAYEPCYRLAR